MAEGGTAGNTPLVRLVRGEADIGPAIASAKANGATGIKLLRAQGKPADDVKARFPKAWRKASPPR